LGGRAPEDTKSYRGRIVLDLDDAVIGEFPILKQVDRLLGSAQGGLFEDGDLTATIADRQLIIEGFTLEGRLAQLHARGSIAFDGQVNVEVLVNTTQIISETGQALVSAIPGLRAVLGRRDAATQHVTSFLSSRLLKLRVTGTVRNPQVNADAGVVVTEAAAGFFGSVLKLPLNLLP
jgi:translocation and assembly module TamB